eukprot:GILJ01014420.1.p1 GENE.GILJ01014420.1~~GILJ01014420.1.p1  ORF type:complete len:309 (-),score=24.95 GILJ01014420.1:799-1725(-)
MQRDPGYDFTTAYISWFNSLVGNGRRRYPLHPLIQSKTNRMMERNDRFDTLRKELMEMRIGENTSSFTIYFEESGILYEAIFSVSSLDEVIPGEYKELMLDLHTDIVWFIDNHSRGSWVYGLRVILPSLSTMFDQYNYGERLKKLSVTFIHFWKLFIALNSTVVAFDNILPRDEDEDNDENLTDENTHNKILMRGFRLYLYSLLLFTERNVMMFPDSSDEVIYWLKHLGEVLASWTNASGLVVIPVIWWVKELPTVTSSSPAAIKIQSLVKRALKSRSTNPTLRIRKDEYRVLNTLVRKRENLMAYQI